MKQVPVLLILELYNHMVPIMLTGYESLSEKHTNLPAVLSFDGIKPNKMWSWEGGNLFSLYPISRFVCFESKTERNPWMQFFVRNPREGHTKIIRNIPVTTDKLIYEIVINSVILDNLRETNNKHINISSNWSQLYICNNIIIQYQ
jgi:hypothetical protein